MLKELEPHEKELITLLRLCDPEDEVLLCSIRQSKQTTCFLIESFTGLKKGFLQSAHVSSDWIIY